MKKKLVILALAVTAAVAALTSTAMAHPDYAQTCTACHSATTAITISANQIANDGAHATYQISTTGSGWAVLDGSTNLGNASASTGQVVVATGKTYTVWGASKGIARSMTISPAAAPLSQMTVAKAAFSNPVAYDLKSLLTTKFTANVSEPGVNAVLRVATPGQNTGSVVVANNVPINTANADVVLNPAGWNALVGGKRLWAASYAWTLTLTKTGFATKTVSGKLIISNIYIPITMVSTGAAQSYARYMNAGASNCYVSGHTTTTGGAMSVRLKGGSSAPTYNKLLSSPALATNLTWAPPTWKLTLPVKSTTAASTFYTVTMTAPVASTCSVSVVQ